MSKKKKIMYSPNETFMLTQNFQSSKSNTDTPQIAVKYVEKTNTLKHDHM